eukprot:8595075-Pyramimonas_sp.AAC.1
MFNDNLRSGLDRSLGGPSVFRHVQSTPSDGPLARACRNRKNAVARVMSRGSFAKKGSELRARRRARAKLRQQSYVSHGLQYRAPRQHINTRFCNICVH